MSARRLSRRALIWTACAIAVLAGVIALGALHPWAPTPSTDSASGKLPMIEPAPVKLPAQPEVLIFGDSWTYGAAADPIERGYAHIVGDLAGWTTTIDGVRGSGYLKPGMGGGSFGERIDALDPSLDPDLVIVQGSINDRFLPLDGYREAVNAAWDSLEATYPDADIVILGPAPAKLPVMDQLGRIERDLSRLAAARGWWYVSPIDAKWITPDNYRTVIDTSKEGRNHPSNAGHAYLAEMLAKAVARTAKPVAPVEAGEPTPTPPPSPGSDGRRR